MVADIVVTFVEKDNSISCVAVCNSIIFQLSRIMSILLTGDVWSVSTRVMFGDDYAIISWRGVMVERSVVRHQEVNIWIISTSLSGYSKVCFGYINEALPE